MAPLHVVLTSPSLPAAINPPTTTPTPSVISPTSYSLSATSHWMWPFLAPYLCFASFCSVEHPVRHPQMRRESIPLILRFYCHTQSIVNEFSGTKSSLCVSPGDKVVSMVCFKFTLGCIMVRFQLPLGRWEENIGICNDVGNVGKTAKLQIHFLRINTTLGGTKLFAVFFFLCFMWTHSILECRLLFGGVFSNFLLFVPLD